AQDLIGNNTHQFDSQIRSWLRASSPRKSCSLRLPATDTFSDVVVDVRGGWRTRPHDIITHLEVQPFGPPELPSTFPHVHNVDRFTSAAVIQGVHLPSLDQGLCHGAPLLCLPAQRLKGGLQQVNSNRQLFTAVCAELDNRDMGILLSISNPNTSLQERWILLPQATVNRSLDGANQSENYSDMALLVRLATKENILRD
ncbi:unnamed protein product, partial [Choristocarpus tenellus]